MSVIERIQRVKDRTYNTNCISLAAYATGVIPFEAAISPSPGCMYPELFVREDKKPRLLGFVNSSTLWHIMVLDPDNEGLFYHRRAAETPVVHEPLPEVRAFFDSQNYPYAGFELVGFNPAEPVSDEVLERLVL